MITSAVFMAVAQVVGIFALGFIIAWLLFKTVQYQLQGSEKETNRPEFDPNSVRQLRLEVEKTRLSAEALRLRTEELRLKALESQVGAVTGGPTDYDNTNSVDST